MGPSIRDYNFQGLFGVSVGQYNFGILDLLTYDNVAHTI